MMKNIELLSPAGDMEKLEAAVHFGANAVYLAGKSFGLRAYCGNFTDEELAVAVRFAHERGVRVYVTVNVYARESDFDALPDYLLLLNTIGVDAILVSDPGIVFLANEIVPKLPLHLSTQANTTNSHAIRFWAKHNVQRVVMARETTLADMKDICVQAHAMGIETEAFVHGAMCVSYSGRCLLSDYLTGRGGNRGECVQACRWEWTLSEASHPNALVIAEDARGSYLLNSKDLCMIEHIPELIDCGIDSFKIEGRMKSPFYVATVTNAYRRAIDGFRKNPIDYTTASELVDEVCIISNRGYDTGFYFDGNLKQNYESGKATQNAEFIAAVKGCDGEFITVEMRNRFRLGDTLTILSPGKDFNKSFTVTEMYDTDGNPVSDAKAVQQILRLKCPYTLYPSDILSRTKND